MQTAQLRIGLVVSRISRLGGGVAESVAKIALSLKATGNLEPIIFTAWDSFTDEDCRRLKGIPIVGQRTLGPQVFSFVPSLLAKVLEWDVNLLHLHGIWQYPSVLAAAWHAKTNRPYVVSPHGMLEPWILQRGRLKKLLAGWLYEHRNLRNATLLHALTGEEASQIRAFTPTARVITIPNGVDSSTLIEAAGSAHNRAPIILYLGRIHPKKNLFAAVDAWTSLSETPVRLDGRFLIAGWGDRKDIIALRAKLSMLPRHASVEFLGAVHGGQKTRLLSEARFVLLPSLSEGLPMTILEAWAAGTPTLMSKFCNLPEGLEAGAALECGVSVEMIRTCLVRALNISAEEWRSMSNAARALVQTGFSSAIIAQRWLETYRKLCAADFNSPHN